MLKIKYNDLPAQVKRHYQFTFSGIWEIEDLTDDVGVETYLIKFATGPSVTWTKKNSGWVHNTSMPNQDRKIFKERDKVKLNDRHL